MDVAPQGWEVYMRSEKNSVRAIGAYCAIVAVFACVSFFALTGCRNFKKEPVKEPLSITWWHINSDQPSQRVYTEIARDFKKMHSYVDVSVVQLENMEYKAKLELEFAAMDPPDVFHGWGGGGLAEQAEAGYLRDISDWVLSDKWQSKINPAALELFSHKGRVYGFPYDLGAVGFWYNRDLLTKAGIATFPSDWDSLLAAFETLKKSGITPVSCGIADRWPVMYYWVYLTMRLSGPTFFKDVYAGTRAFNDPGMIRAGYLMRALIERGFFPATAIGDDFIAQSRHMGDGLCAAQLMGQWAIAVQSQASERKDELASVMSFAPFPTVRGGVGKTSDAMGGGNGFVIGKNAPDEAVELLEFFARAENLQRLFDVFPGVSTVSGIRVANPGLGMVQAYLSTMETYSLYPDQMFPLSVGTALNETSARVMVGEISPEEGVRILDEEWAKKGK